MRYTEGVKYGGSREFYFPGMHGRYLAVCAYLDSRGMKSPVTLYVGGPAIHDLGVPMADRYIPAPPEAIRHAADTADPSLLIDWLLENACDTRPWLAEALQAAVAGAGAR